MAEATEAQLPPADASSAPKPASIELSTSDIPALWDVGEVIWAKLEGYPWWPAQV